MSPEDLLFVMCCLSRTFENNDINNNNNNDDIQTLLETIDNMNNTIKDIEKAVEKKAKSVSIVNPITENECYGNFENLTRNEYITLKLSRPSSFTIQKYKLTAEINIEKCKTEIKKLDALLYEKHSKYFVQTPIIYTEREQMPAEILDKICSYLTEQKDVENFFEFLKLYDMCIRTIWSGSSN